MEVCIKHCNNIDLATISIGNNKLNIKFAPNGTGKSTLANAIRLSQMDSKDSLNELMPFKYRESNPDGNQPTVTGIEGIGATMCFNEAYVNQFTFKPDELLDKSFDILIRDDNYKATEQEINQLVRNIQEQFTNNPDLEKLIKNLKALSDAFKVTANGGLSKASSGMKGLSSGNKIEHIPASLEVYQPFIQSKKSVSWIDWQTKGHKEFSELSNSCPFCSSDATEKKEQIEKVGKEYNKNLINNLVKIISIIQDLGEFFSEDTRNKLDIISSLKDGIEKEHETFIVNIKSQIDDLIEKLERTRALSSFHFQEGENVGAKLPTYKIDLQFFDTLNSEKTREATDRINQSIDDLVLQAGPLQGKINIQRRKITQLIEKHQTDINSFLINAGYKYIVEIIGEGEQSQLKLKHVDHSIHISGGTQHLSFGERNAFSIVLFMYECLSKKPNLIILDDPISSFDKNKKYAILEMLFKRKPEHCLKNKTVLLLTHDVEPIIDTVKAVKKQFKGQVFASYLRLQDGNITEQQIKEEDIKTFAQICTGILSTDCSEITKLIYLRRRFEILDDKGDAYQVLSNLFHKRTEPRDYREPANEEGEYPLMSDNALEAGRSEINRFIDGFEYDALLERLLNTAQIKSLYFSCENGYEKLQLCRILMGKKANNSVIKKFINETYHIENEYICQLDPTKYDLIPQYVINACDKMIEEILD
ncbi:AAA family ATPase [Sessilibacter sp. MAH2]